MVNVFFGGTGIAYHLLGGTRLYCCFQGVFHYLNAVVFLITIFDLIYSMLWYIGKVMQNIGE